MEASSCTPTSATSPRTRRIGTGCFAIFPATPPRNRSYASMLEPVDSLPVAFGRYLTSMPNVGTMIRAEM